MQRKRAEIWEMEWEWGCGEPAFVENLGENVKNIRNQGGKLSIAVKII